MFENENEFDDAYSGSLSEVSSARLSSMFEEECFESEQLSNAVTSQGISTFLALASGLATVLILCAAALGAFSWKIEHSTDDVSFTACEALDLIAMHPDDPDRLADLPSFTDEELSQLLIEDVDVMLSAEFVQEVMALGNRRHLFALGRIAFFHDRDELSFDLLSVAADLESAAAYMYLAEFYEADLGEALSLATRSSELGFQPAEVMQEMIRSQSMQIIEQPSQPIANQPVAVVVDGRFETSFFQQRDLIETMLFENQVNPSRLVLPEPTPSFLDSDTVHSLFGDSGLRDVIAKLYCYHLAIAIGEKAREENPAYLFDVPKLNHLVQADISSISRVGLQTKELLIFCKGMPIAARLSVLRPLIAGIQNFDSSQFSFESLTTKGKEIAGAAFSHHAELKEAELFGESVKQQAEQDANLLQAAYYDGRIEETSNIYTALSSFVRSTHR